MMINELNGQIYLKKTPKTIYTPTKEDLDTLEIVNNDAVLEESKPELDFGSFDGCLSFWQAYDDENGIDLIERSMMPSENLILHFNSEEEINKEFISLNEFLEKATFVGRKWRIPGSDRFAEMLNSDRERTVLYEYDNMSLALDIHTEFGLMFALMLRDPEAYGKNNCLCEVNNEVEAYKDKAFTYKKVYNYLSRGNIRGL